MSYTVIEDIVENPLTNQYKNQQSKNTNMWSNTPKQSMRPDFANNPQYDPQYDRYKETSAMPMEYGEHTVQQKQIMEKQQNSNNKRTSISKVMSTPSVQQQQAVSMPSTSVSNSLPQTTPAPVTNEMLDDKLKRIAFDLGESVKFFVQKTRRMEDKLVMIDQLLKGIGIILILLLIFMMIRKN